MNGNFFDQFSFFTGADPTNGFVQYQSRSSAESASLISGSSGDVTFGVDSTQKQPNGRPSVRLTSNKIYQSGLIILDAYHMPGGICGTWPAFWTVGPDWPNQGEIDIIEGVNDQSANDMTLHTGPGCSISSNSKFSGSIATNNCDINAAGQDTNAGCKIATSNTNTYGSGFNSIGGGTYATEWTGSAISIYFFPNGSAPSDIASGSPDPSSWGEPMATFQGGCDFSSTFTNQQIVFDTTFCGDWAGKTWSSSSCSSKANTCENFVANNPGAFQDAFWSVTGLKVYQKGAGSGGSGQSSAPAPGPSSAPAPAPSNSGWGSGSPSTFASSTRPAGPSYSAPAQSSAPASAPAPSGSGWPAPSGAPSQAPSGAPSAAPSAAPSGAPSAVPQHSGVPGWPAPSQSYGGSPPWQSGGWTEHATGNGALAVGQPIQAKVETTNHRAKHLGKHKKHGAGRL